MSYDNRQSYSPKTSSTNPPTDRVPVITWIIGAAAAVVLLTGGALLLEAEPKTAEETPEASQSEEDRPEPTPEAEIASANPLDITAWFLDAQERSKLWNPKAMLAKIEVIVADGRPSGPVKFEFGEAIGRAVPGAPLSPKQYTVSYVDDSIEEDAVDTSRKRLALPEPNCPLEVAFNKLTQGGIDTSGRVAVAYVNSEKHGRPVWLVTNERGQATSVNADTCSLLLR